MTIKHTADSFSALVDRHLAAAKTHLETLRGLPTDATAETVARTFDAIGVEVGAVTGLAEILSAVHPDEGVRTAAESAIQRMSAFTTELSLDRSAYEPFSRLDLSQPMTPEVQRFVEHTLRDYRRGGVDKDDATREKIRALQEKLVQTGQLFDRNIMTGGKKLRLEGGHADLVGLPQDFLDAHPEDADGSVTLSTDPTDFLPVLLYAERDETRHDFFMVYHTRAFPENDPVLKQLLAERHELAQTLGFEHWAQFSCEDKMIGSAEAAREFAMKVTDLARPVARAEYDELLEELRTLDPGAERVRPWQSRFLMERVKRKKHSFDSQSVRPYFAYTSVKEGILRTTEALFGVEIRLASDEQGDVHFWHESVECYDVFENSKRTARFYLDMFPRDAKFKHAAMFQLYAGLEGERRQLPEAALVCNFPEPKPGDPALLLHDQVTTFFHEFGHLLHHLFAVSTFNGFAGIACEWDFVEVPSQLYEEWAWSASVLQKFATHHETGEPIPTELVERLRAAEEYGKGLGVNGQMLYALFSLTLYDRDPAGVEPGELMGDMQRELTLYEKVPGTAMHAAFGHLHGYSANYYTYMWSLVISKDFFGQFEGDLMDTTTARRYRDEVLAQGGAEDASEMVKSFLGREAGFAAWESWLKA
ncbi:Oligopeptidase A [Planctomycetes bacterium Poly30]|uniref:Oligopeptidase A n=1 Tax=Saltatorellus ferox TaxID=2528018 RepID=A0A518EXA3_9BACT|nr:Oligopeptidase A [Planctomycetes bacterium Poly30]